ncbi:hypothetical protein [Pseudomonas sp.]|uniref:hypothetical protein n=1 Tax=Pseudomonas sp. TaxID=306 RepID=UPI0026019D63|nr:hypothetical protein [Pseudomonas sp.]
MKKLVEQVKQWGVNKGLHKVGHLAQAKYTLKETAELLDAYADGNIEEINDAIGDILVTLIVGASNDDDIFDYAMKKSVEYSLPKDSHIYGNAFAKLDGLNTLRHLVGEVLFLIHNCKEDAVKDYHYDRCLDALYCVAIGINNEFHKTPSLQDCLQLAYNEIKDRTGKINEDGNFIKD